MNVYLRSLKPLIYIPLYVNFRTGSEGDAQISPASQGLQAETRDHWYTENPFFMRWFITFVLRRTLPDQSRLTCLELGSDLEIKTFTGEISQRLWCLRVSHVLAQLTPLLKKIFPFQIGHALKLTRNLSRDWISNLCNTQSKKESRTRGKICRPFLWVCIL